jgi:hypothetical protein
MQPPPREARGRWLATGRGRSELARVQELPHLVARPAARQWATSWAPRLSRPPPRACRVAGSCVKEKLIGGTNPQGDRASQCGRPVGLNADLAPRSKRGRPSEKGRPPGEAREQRSSTQGVIPPPRREARGRRPATDRGGSTSPECSPAYESILLRRIWRTGASTAAAARDRGGCG